MRVPGNVPLHDDTRQTADQSSGFAEGGACGISMRGRPGPAPAATPPNPSEALI